MTDTLVRIATPRKRDGDERRRELCDAGIRVLAEQGSRGLTHQQVDRAANVPDGTTSYYYRTRAALLRGVGERVAAIDRENLRSFTDAATKTDSPFGRLAELIVMQSRGDGLLLNIARQELLLAGARDPALAETFELFVSRVVAMTHDAIAALNFGPVDEDVRNAQGDAVITLIAGLFTRYASGDRSMSDAKHIERLLEAVVTGIATQALEHARD
ncbi:TetR family transcriptional regulator [Mycobacterium sp. MFM001]|uniref:TetR/AcrR family transcriptional regulator n=1 Tax=Mycobacterium sp. MFM001 TaxID=2049453 RepID=UPI000DA426F8|nr:TetR/AcrR family transcriptional regulator [Mycobacterium sp. MFM001]GBE66709.1 TetR family transcriptional regulator [Mycobacterium sp. MFM001]